LAEIGHEDAVTREHLLWVEQQTSGSSGNDEEAPIAAPYIGVGPAEDK
jgi:hypothetical protein